MYLETIKDFYPNIDMETALGVYGMCTLLSENKEADVREVFVKAGYETLDEETENIIAMAKSINTHLNVPNTEE